MSYNDVSPSGKGTATNKRSSPNRRARDENQYSMEQRDLLQGITEKEVEIEHLKTVIVALDQKVKVLESVREDLAQEKDHSKQSEGARVELQMVMKQTSVQVLEMGNNNKKF